jgi:phosphoglycerate kinase
MKTLKDLDVKNKRVLVRCDFNVPLDDKGNVLDDFKIRQTIPTIKYLMGEGARIILMSHLGRPDGKIVEKLRLTPVQDKLMEYLDVSITKSSDCIGPEIKNWANKMQPGEIILLENVQFNPGEKENDQNFAKTLAGCADIFIMEAFGQAHRNYASTASIPKYLPSAPGFLFEKEVKILTDLLSSPQKPLVAVIGGAKVESKAKVINKISETADWVLIGGLIQKEIREKKIELRNLQKIVSPIDEMAGGLDIGPKTISIFQEKISQTKTVFWNGPLGRIEDKKFAEGTKAIAQAIANSGAFSVVGGGETVDFINDLGLAEKFNYVSTGGGAMLEFLSGEKLPGLEALK